MVSTAKFLPFAILGFLGVAPAAAASAEAFTTPAPAQIVHSVHMAALDDDDAGPPNSGSGSAPDGSFGGGGPEGGGGCNADGVCGGGGPQGGGGSIPGVGSGHGGPEGGGGCINGICVNIP